MTTHSVPPKQPDMQPPTSPLPRLMPRATRAWRLLRRAKPFYLVRNSVTYYVNRGGWAKVVSEPSVAAVHASKLLDPAKKPVF